MKFTKVGWKVHKGLNLGQNLPALAVKFVRRIEEFLETPVSILSTSPRREDTILGKKSV